MSNRIVSPAALAFAAAWVIVSASAAAAQKPDSANAAIDKKAAPEACTACVIEVENRLDFQVHIIDGRDTRRFVGTLKPLGKALPSSTVTVETQAWPKFGISVIKDDGTPPALAGLSRSEKKDTLGLGRPQLVKCRQQPPGPNSKADFRFVCGN